MIATVVDIFAEPTQPATGPVALTIFAGLVCWVVTKIIVESELTRPLRDSLERAMQNSQERRPGNWSVLYFDTRRTWFWRKVQYLFNCHLCTGCWVGLILALLFDGPYPSPDHPVAVALTALTYKAIGHVVLTIEGALTR